MDKITLMKLGNGLVKFCTGTMQKSGNGAQKSRGNMVKTPRIRAWAIHSYGDLDELQLTTSRMPVIKNSSEMLVKVQAASINPIDYMMIKGYAQTFGRFLRNHQLEFPLILGRDFSGIVMDKGQDVENFQIGDKVYGVLPFHRPGSHAEVVIAEQALTRLKPLDWSFPEASSILYAGLTAWSALYLTGELCLRNPEKYRVLVTGASGGVGTIAVQMLAASGSTVIATCSDRNVHFITDLGAERAHDYRDQHFIHNVANDGPYDIILDCANIGHEKISPSWYYTKFITLNAPLVRNTDNYGVVGGLAVSVRDLIVANIPQCASGKTVRWGFFAPFHAGVEFIDDMIRQKKLRPVIHGIHSFGDVPRAFENLKEGNLLGKIVIDMTI